MAVSATAPVTFNSYSQQSQNIRKQSTDVDLQNKATAADDMVKRAGRAHVNNDQAILQMRQYTASRGSTVDIFA